MTVCVAAMANKGDVLFCGADRMLTKGDVTYEPKDQQKVYTLGDKALVLVAGNMVVHAEIAHAFTQHFQGDNSRDLQEYADKFAALFQARRDQIREREVLGRRSLTMQSYLSNAPQMPDFWVRQIDREMVDFDLSPHDSVEAIFVGKDQTGSHIFTVENDRVSCNDLMGYAVIGSGYSVADSQFVFAKHSPNVSAERAIYTLYRAKRMAEQAVGVGDQSDWRVIVDKAMPLHENVVKLLGELYEEEIADDQQRFTEAEEKIKADIDTRMPKAEAAVLPSITSPSTEQQPLSEQSEPAGKK